MTSSFPEDAKIKQETPSPPPPQQRKRKVIKPPQPHESDSTPSSSPELDRKPSSQALKRRLGPPLSSAAQTTTASSTVGEGSDSKSSVFKRLGGVEEEVETKKMKKNVFDRLESVTVKKVLILYT